MSSSVMFSAYTMILENIHIPQVIEHWAIIAGWLSRYNTCTSAYCYIYHLIQVTLHQNNNRTSLCNTQPSFYGLCWIVINFPELNSSASFIQINTVTEASSFTHNHKNVSLSISVCPIRNMYTNPLYHISVSQSNLGLYIHVLPNCYASFSFPLISTLGLLKILFYNCF